MDSRVENGLRFGGFLVFKTSSGVEVEGEVISLVVGVPLISFISACSDLKV